jgi:hypothetical protein
VCCVESRSHRLRSEIHCHVDVGVVRGGEAVQLGIARQRQCEVARVDTAGAHEAFETRRGDADQFACDVVLGMAVLREGHGGAGDARRARSMPGGRFGGGAVRCIGHGIG